MLRSFASGRRRVLALVGTVSGTVVLALAVATPQVAVGQATRTWISGVGDDANPCSRTAPCKTFAGAISKTATGGEINVLDPGGFGGVTITKAITLSAVGVEGGVLVSGTNAITVNVGAGANVVLSGLDIEGLGSGVDGVHIVGVGTTIIRDSTIHNFTGNAVNLATASGAKASIEDSYLSQNGGGVAVGGNAAVVDNTTIETNVNFAIKVDAGGAAFLSESNLIGGGQKIKLNGGGTLTSYGNNVIRGSSDAPTTTLGLQ